MVSIYTQIAYCSWIVLFIVWLPGYFTSKTVIRKPNPGKQFITTLLIVGCFIFLFSDALRADGLLGIVITPQTQALGMIGALINVLAVAFAIWARFALGRNWSGVITVKENHELIQKGPYRIVRHPIYTGFVFGAFGMALTLGFLASYIGFLLGLIAFLIRVHDEDALMAAQFPDTHPAYRSHTKKLIPFVW